MTFVTIFTSFSPTEAEIIRSRLEASDFHPVIQHDNPTGTLGFSTVSGGVQVQVPEAEADDAKEFLDTPDQPAE